jgi:hypothetical protein
MIISRFLILVLINVPIVIFGILSAIVGYKTKRISKRRGVIEVICWLLAFVVLACVEPIYKVLVEQHLTDSGPMSIFDMVLLTLVLLCLLLIVRANEKLTTLNKKLSLIHEHVVIKESAYDQKAAKK